MKSGGDAARAVALMRDVTGCEALPPSLDWEFEVGFRNDDAACQLAE